MSENVSMNLVNHSEEDFGSVLVLGWIFHNHICESVVSITYFLFLGAFPKINRKSQITFDLSCISSTRTTGPIFLKLDIVYLHQNLSAILILVYLYFKVHFT
jgi:hypothetical protein